MDLKDSNFISIPNGFLFEEFLSRRDVFLFERAREELFARQNRGH
jgi:hypothetical protein